MSEVTTRQKNVIIARFEGRKWLGKYTIDNYGPGTHMEYPELKYHSDWSWLMPVVDRIEAIDNNRFAFYIGYMEAYVIDKSRPSKSYICISHRHAEKNSTKLSITYEAVYQFSKWYNKTKEQQP